MAHVPLVELAGGACARTGRKVPAEDHGHLRKWQEAGMGLENTCV